jgi:TonB family protein
MDVTQLQGKIVFLRGMDAGDKLSFDAQGAELSSHTPGAFAFSALKIEKVRASGTEVTLQGRRVALVFNTKSNSPSLHDMEYIPLHEKVQIAIAEDPSHPGVPDPTLSKIFALHPKDELWGMTPKEERAALDTLGSTAAPEAGSASEGTAEVPGDTLSPQFIEAHKQDITPPRIVYSVEPTYPDKSKLQEISGVCLLSMIVDTNGRPIQIRVAQSPNPDLDISAIIAASKYRFIPAMYHGDAAPVMIQVQVSFRVASATTSPLRKS